MSLFYVEGNIGSGKTTLLEKLKVRGDTEVVIEPVDVWTSIKGKDDKNLLESFYIDPKRYAHLLQTIIFTTRLESIDVPQVKPIRICERSILTDKNVFVKNAIMNSMFDELEKNCYIRWFDWLEGKFHKKPSGIIYLRTSPEKCYERMRKRNRDGEETVSLEYLKDIHERHDEWLKTVSCPVLILDNDTDDEWNWKLDMVDMFIV